MRPAGALGLSGRPLLLAALLACAEGEVARRGIRNNGAVLAAGRRRLLAEIPRHRGLRTAAFVSAAVLQRRFGLEPGFGHYDDDLAAGKPLLCYLFAGREDSWPTPGAEAGVPA